MLCEGHGPLGRCVPQPGLAGRAGGGACAANRPPAAPLPSRLSLRQLVRAASAPRAPSCQAPEPAHGLSSRRATPSRSSPAGFLALDVGVVAALAIGAYFLDNPLVWPLYWFAQGTMFWALFVVGHDW